MKLKLLTAAGVVLGGFCLAAFAPAYAEPEYGARVAAEETGAGHDADFLESLQAAGITFAGSGQAIEAARTVCMLVDRGETGLQVIADLKAHNPGFTTDGATQFAAIAARTYCPQQLAKM